MIDGIADGSIYAALALALVLIFRSTGIVNFAQGEMAMFSHLRRLGARPRPGSRSGSRCWARWPSRSSAGW